MLQRRVGEAVNQAVGVGGEIYPGDAQRRGLFIEHQATGSVTQRAVRHAVVDMGETGQIAEIRQERMAAVEHAQLHLLPRQDVLHHLYSGYFPLRAASDKVVLDHPLDKGLAADGARILDTHLTGDFCKRVVCGSGHDPVHHGAREADVSGDPLRQLRRTLVGHAQHRVFHHMAVIGNIIAGKDAERRKTPLATAMQRFDQDPRRGVRFIGIVQIVNDAFITGIQLAGGRIDAVALFGNGQGDNRHLRLAKLLNNCRQRIQLCVQAFMHRPHDNRLITFSAFFQHRKQMILRA